MMPSLSSVEYSDVSLILALVFFLETDSANSASREGSEEPDKYLVVCLLHVLCCTKHTRTQQCEHHPFSTSCFHFLFFLRRSVSVVFYVADVCRVFRR